MNRVLSVSDKVDGRLSTMTFRELFEIINYKITITLYKLD